MVFDLNEYAMTAALLREYYRNGGMHSPYQANMQTLENGNIFIGWGSGPRCSEFTIDGERIFDMRYRAGVSYRGYRVEWSATPSTAPDYELDKSADGTLSCFVSWNGAIDVEEWRVVTGSVPAAATEVARAEKSSFKTALTGISNASYMKVQALNAAGMVLAGRVFQRGN